MANFRSSPQGNNDWPSTSLNKVVEDDPMIVRVPLADVEIGAPKFIMAKIRGTDGFRENRMAIRHVDGKKAV